MFLKESKEKINTWLRKSAYRKLQSVDPVLRLQSCNRLHLPLLPFVLHFPYPYPSPHPYPFPFHLFSSFLCLHPLLYPRHSFCPGLCFGLCESLFLLSGFVWLWFWVVALLLWCFHQSNYMFIKSNLYFLLYLPPHLKNLPALMLLGWCFSFSLFHVELILSPPALWSKNYNHNNKNYVFY